LAADDKTHLGAASDWRADDEEWKRHLENRWNDFLAICFAVVLPLALKVVGITLGIIIGLAVLLIKVAVTLAIAYLVLVGIRALLR
jgi:hypothetical protein